ncbi:phosphonate ABC transporter, permease protein PhnE [Liquorilactobacillus oeni]|uniref:ABC-type phosphate phosphonate transport system, permease component n=1 Tax=Liquorilactobacillus oeni DSM 19972 TaxID=1423777 RepID=A0A0R1MAW8_9LACO|nr:phosphonate ABC transporter, permease protein PhnE [Liquorilactobacillus oeni]KRL05057.1 ABC-type phosphate phosphonate transport system, permease component [Liquorilactobacillus oeni DSM 19972]
MNEIPKRTIIQKYHVRGILITVILSLLLIFSSIMTGVDWSEFFSNLGQFFALLGRMANPDWQYLNVVVQPIIETIQMALLGTTIGTAVAIPFAFLAARNLVKSLLVRGVTRFVLNLVRTLPDLLLAALFVAIVGIGPTAGVWTLAIFSFGMISKLFYETVETIEKGPIEALRAAGANKIQIIVFAVIPQVINNFISYFLYTFEINVRASTVLGYLGAGGIGVFLQRSLSSFRYDQTAVIIIAILIVVVIIDSLSNTLRERLL